MTEIQDIRSDQPAADRYRGRHIITLGHIGMPTRMAVGARDFVHDDTNGMLMFRVGSSHGAIRKIIVILELNDTYTVGYGHMPTRGAHKYEWITDATRTDIYAEQLSQTVYGLVNS
jgi:hypothetical protein